MKFPDRKSLNFNYKGTYANLEFAPEGFTSMVSSRECPYQCSFCYGSRSSGFRTRSVENIIEEILYLESEGFSYVNFVDDNFTLSREAVYAFDTPYSVLNKIKNGALNRIETIKGSIMNAYAGGTIFLNNFRGYK